jgi:superfamily I DNA/RNA helicase
MVNLFAVQTSGFRVGQRQLLHGAGHADVGQTTLLHSAKGLEFPQVFIVGVEEGMFPSQMALDEGGRLFAVQTSGFRVGQRQLLHGAGHADVGQTTLFFQALEAGEGQADTWQDAVQLMTLHSAKGLEFPQVFIVARVTPT